MRCLFDGYLVEVDLISFFPSYGLGGCCVVVGCCVCWKLCPYAVFVLFVCVPTVQSPTLFPHNFSYVSTYVLRENDEKSALIAVEPPQTVR